MKKLLVLLIPFIIGCRDHKNVTIPKDEYDKLKGIKAPEYPKAINIDIHNAFHWELFVSEDGHTYCSNNGGHGFCLFHYPECKKCKVTDSLMMVSILKTLK
jgi:hypothetical protein